MSLHTFFCIRSGSELDRISTATLLMDLRNVVPIDLRNCENLKVAQNVIPMHDHLFEKTTNDRFQTDECDFYASDADSSCFHLFEIDQRSVHRRPSSVRNRTLINFKQINQHDTYFRHFLSHRPQQKLNISSTFLETFLTNRRAQRGHFSNRFIDFSSEFFKKSARAARKIF